MFSALLSFAFQGSPEFVAFSQCVHYFEWKTYTACKKDKFKPHKEVGNGGMNCPHATPSHRDHEAFDVTSTTPRDADAAALLCLQVPCYIFDSDGKKHDLSPLIKLKDGYLVDDGDDGVDFYINVCRSICRFLLKPA